MATLNLYLLVAIEPLDWDALSPYETIDLQEIELV